MKKYTDKKLIEKMFRNSFWKTYVPNFFYWHSAEKAEKVTEMGRKSLLEMINQF